MRPYQREERLITRRSLLGILAGALAALGVVASSPTPARAAELSTIKSRGALIVGMKADYPPFGYPSPSGQIVGVEPDLALAQRLRGHLGIFPR